MVCCGVCVCMCIDMQGSEKCVGCLSVLLSTLFPETVCHWACSLLFQPGRLASELLGCACFGLGVEVTGMCSHAWYLHRYWESESRSLSLYSKHSYSLTYMYLWLPFFLKRLWNVWVMPCFYSPLFEWKKKIPESICHIILCFFSTYLYLAVSPRVAS